MKHLFVKNIIKHVICILASIFSLIIGVFMRWPVSRTLACKFFDSFLFQLGSNNKEFYFSYHQRPKYIEEINYSSIFKRNNRNDDIAIVMQGPISYKDNFTFETIKLYRKNFPDATIVLSIWEGESASLVDEIKKLGVSVVISVKPKVSGSHNINFQIVSTLNGIDEGINKGAKYILKTRTDQRFYAQTTLDYMRYLHSSYPINSELNAKGRIIEPSFSICKYRLWSMCDMFQFGDASDMRKMWDIPLDERSRTVNDFLAKRYTVRDIVEERVAEIYVHRLYSKKIGLADGVNSHDYYHFIRNSMVIFDKEQIDLFWRKYTSQEYGLAVNPLYAKNQILSRIYHAEWLDIISGKEINYSHIDSMLDCFEN